MWVVIYGKVFDLTQFYMEHPGGYEVIEEYGGKDATQMFEEGDHCAASVRDLKKHYIGEYEGKRETLSDMKSKKAKE